MSLRPQKNPFAIYYQEPLAFQHFMACGCTSGEGGDWPHKDRVQSVMSQASLLRVTMDSATVTQPDSQETFPEPDLTHTHADCREINMTPQAKV